MADERRLYTQPNGPAMPVPGQAGLPTPQAPAQAGFTPSPTVGRPGMQAPPAPSFSDRVGQEMNRFNQSLQNTVQRAGPTLGRMIGGIAMPTPVRQAGAALAGAAQGAPSVAQGVGQTLGQMIGEVAMPTPVRQAGAALAGAAQGAPSVAQGDLAGPAFYARPMQAPNPYGGLGALTQAPLAGSQTLTPQAGLGGLEAAGARQRVVNPAALPVEGVPGGFRADLSQSPELQAEFGQAIYGSSPALAAPEAFTRGLGPTPGTREAAANLAARYAPQAQTTAAPPGGQAQTGITGTPSAPMPRTSEWERELLRRNARVGLDTITRRGESAERRKSRELSNAAIQTGINQVEARLAAEDAARETRGLRQEDQRTQRERLRQERELGLAGLESQERIAQMGRQPRAQFTAGELPTYTTNELGQTQRTGSEPYVLNTITGELVRPGQQQQGLAGARRQVTTKAERDALPPGTQYIGPDGKLRVKSG